MPGDPRSRSADLKACDTQLARASRGFVALCLLLVSGCGGGGQTAGHGGSDSLTRLSSRDGTLQARLDRMERAWQEAPATERPAARQRLKDIAWNSAEPFELRSRAVELLSSDADAAGADEARSLVKLMLPREQSRGMVAMLCQLCVNKGWQDATPALVRSYSRVIDQVAEQDRAERWALGELNPGTPLLDLAFGVFLDPQTDPGPAGANFDQRARADAWAVLARLDPSGAERRRLLAGVTTANADVELMRRCARELSALPNTPAEIEWVRSLLGGASADNRAWVEQTGAAVARLDDAQKQGLLVRHLEPIRWASLGHAEWLGRTREELLSELAGRLAGRPNFQRRIERTQGGELRPEDLAFWQRELAWGDVLTILVLDEVIVDPGFEAALWPQLDQDRGDRTTEYGGLIQDVPRSGGIRPILFVPRSATREGDMAFPEPTDMVRQGDRAMAMFHFHAAELELLDHAGPSQGDLNYARTTGRNCLVLTSLRERRLAVDYYQPNGVVIDLGEIPR